ncbi:hypothetical protein RUND412_011254 [Rhizina undulata]
MNMPSLEISERTAPLEFIKNMLIYIRLFTLFAIVCSVENINLEVKHISPAPLPTSIVVLRIFTWLSKGWGVFSAFWHTLRGRLSLAISIIDGLVAMCLIVELFLFEHLAGPGCRITVDDEVEDEEDVDGGRISGIHCYVVRNAWLYGLVTVALLLVSALVVAIVVRLRERNGAVVGDKEEGIAVVEVREVAGEEQEIGERRSKFVEKV